MNICCIVYLMESLHAYIGSHSLSFSPRHTSVLGLKHGQQNALGTCFIIIKLKEISLFDSENTADIQCTL